MLGKKKLPLKIKKSKYGLGTEPMTTTVYFQQHAAYCATTALASSTTERYIQCVSKKTRKL